MSSPVEKRVENRFQVLDCSVRLEPTGIMDRFRNQAHRASAINLSPGGMQVISNDMLKTKKEYDIDIYTRVFRQPIPTKGRVVWQKPHDGKDDKRYYRIGLEFTYFKEYAMEQLEALKISPHLH